MIVQASFLILVLALIGSGERHVALLRDIDAYRGVGRRSVPACFRVELAGSGQMRLRREAAGDARAQGGWACRSAAYPAASRSISDLMLSSRLTVTQSRQVDLAARAGELTSGLGEGAERWSNSMTPRTIPWRVWFSAETRRRKNAHPCPRVDGVPSVATSSSRCHDMASLFRIRSQCRCIPAMAAEGFLQGRSHQPYLSPETARIDDHAHGRVGH